MSRDYIAEMRAVIDAETAGGSYSSPVVAEHIVAKLRATDPELLDGWLHAQAVSIVRHAINLRDCSVRTHARLSAGRSRFAADAQAHADGDAAAMGHWLALPFVVADGSRPRLADMTHEDLLFAAGTYTERAEQNRMTAAFLSALAKKVRRGTVKDHFTEPQLAAMWQSLTGRAA